MDVLLQDTLLALLGCYGDIVTPEGLSPEARAVLPKPGRVFFERHLQSVAQDAGYVSNWAALPSDSVYLNAFKASLNIHCVQRFQEAVAEIEERALSSLAYPLVSLQVALGNWPLVFSHVRRVLRQVEESEARGIPLLSLLQRQVDTCAPTLAVYPVLLEASRAVALPFFTQASRWLLQGELLDPSGEFFIEEDGDEFAIVLARAPSLPYERLKDIHFCGSTVRLLADAPELRHHLPMALREQLHEQLMELDFGDSVEQIRRRVGAALWQVLSERMQMRPHLHEVHRNFCLGDGTLVGHILRTCETPFEAQRRWPALQRGAVDSWDDLALSADWERPLNRVFTPELAAIWQRSFQLLFKLKRALHALHIRWQLERPAPQHPVYRMMRALHALEQTFFVDVVYTNYAELLRKLDGGAREYEMLTQALDVFTTQVHKRLYLSSVPATKALQRALDASIAGDADTFDRYYGLFSDLHSSSSSITTSM